MEKKGCFWELFCKTLNQCEIKSKKLFKFLKCNRKSSFLCFLFWFLTNPQFMKLWNNIEQIQDDQNRFASQLWKNMEHVNIFSNFTRKEGVAKETLGQCTLNWGPFRSFEFATGRSGSDPKIVSLCWWRQVVYELKPSFIGILDISINELLFFANRITS